MVQQCCLIIQSPSPLTRIRELLELLYCPVEIALIQYSLTDATGLELVSRKIEVPGATKLAVLLSLKFHYGLLMNSR